MVDFAKLSKMMQDRRDSGIEFNHGYNEPEDPPTYAGACMGLMVCPHCGRALMCGDIEQQENEEMIPRGTGRISDDGNTTRRKKKGSGLRYLSAEMLSTTHQLATIADARVQDDTFRKGQECVVVKLKFKGEFILWTLREGNPNLEALGDAMGDDEQQWKGRDIELYLEVDNFDGKSWIRSEVVASASKRGK